MWIYVTEITQLFSFALFLSASVYYTNEIMVEKDKVKGQAYLTCSGTIGAMLGSFLGGWLIEHFGVETMMWVGVALSAVGSVYVVLVMPKTRPSCSKVT